MKTILVPIFHGQVSRNFFLTNIFKILNAAPDVRLVVVTHDFKKDYYQQKFGRDNVLIESVGLDQLKTDFWEPIFRSLFFCFVNSQTVRMLQKEELALGHNWPAYLLKRLATLTLGKSRILRRLVRWLYYILVPAPPPLAALFTKYHPDLVLLPDVTFQLDSYLLAEAKSKGLPSIGLLRSWDVLTSNKGTMRLLPDYLVVHNDWMKMASSRWGDLTLGAITVAGMPHFDYYFNPRPSNWSDFCRKLGLDPTKRLILFFLNGWAERVTDQGTIEAISGAIADGRLPRDLQLLVRAHPNFSLGSFEAARNVVIHYPRGLYFSKGRLADMEFTEEFLQDLLDSIFHSQVTINTQSTTSIDAAVFDKPVINIVFDGYQNLPYHRSVRRFYQMDHYQPVIRSGGARLVRSADELVDWLNRYLVEPGLDRAGRRRLLEEQCYKFDGQSAKRTAQYVLDFLGKLPVSNTL